MKMIATESRTREAHPTVMRSRPRPLIVLLLTAVGSLLSGCRSSSPNAQAASPPPPPPVEVVNVEQQSVPIYSEYAAQTYARDMVDVRGRVDGYLEQRLFQVGSEVTAGQVLYILDLRPYEAEVARAKGDVAQAVANLEFAKNQVALAQAEADLAQADANLLKSKQDVDRLRPLVKEDAASQQDLDNATASFQANQANVNAKRANVEQNRLNTRAQIDVAGAQLESRKATLRTAELNLEYATIRSPIAGRIGDTTVQVGGLVNRTSAVPLTTIVPLDPIWVRFKVSEAEYLNFRRRTGSEQDQTRRNPLRLVLADGRIHEYEGKFQNATNQVDSKTGTLELQATFPNPNRAILPGQFGRVRLHMEDKKDVIVIPQKAVVELQGMQSVLTVGPESKVVPRSVVTGQRIDEGWIIEQGLKPGDRVIVEGVQKARQGTIVNAKPYQTKAK
jgi:membrane fusion protein (multidrug efflux system)